MGTNVQGRESAVWGKGWVAATILAAATACGGAQPDLATPASEPRAGSAAEHRVGASDAQVGAETGAIRGREPSDAEEVNPLLGVEWQWVRFVDPLAGAIDVPHPERYALTFDDEGIIHIRADCKEGQGAYMLDRNELIVRILRTTEDDCGEASLADEFIDNVNSASSFEVVDGELVVSLRWDTGTMRFTSSAPDESSSESAPHHVR